MQATEKKSGQAWTWAIGINLVVFVLLWVAFARIPSPAQPAQVAETPPGDTFGQMTHLMGSPSTAGSEIPGGSGQQTPPPTQASGQTSNQWIDEFYLDQGPAISFAPRLNADGTPRSIPGNQEIYKSPTYEDQNPHIPVEDTNPPRMTPQFFSKAELPPELRGYNYQMTVRATIDARGQVRGTPQVSQSSTNPLVDQITIKKIMNDVSFTPATRKDNNQPILVTYDIPVYWN